MDSCLQSGGTAYMKLLLTKEEVMDALFFYIRGKSTMYLSLATSLMILQSK